MRDSLVFQVVLEHYVGAIIVRISGNRDGHTHRCAKNAVAEAPFVSTAAAINWVNPPETG